MPEKDQIAAGAASGESAGVVLPIRLESRIFRIRERQVMLDADLARLYQVETWVLIQAVKRNLDRFPTDFMFQLSQGELERPECSASSSQAHLAPYAVLRCLVRLGQNLVNAIEVVLGYLSRQLVNLS